MTELSEDGNYLVRVRAQVMTRDDSSGGWVPLSGGGLANVSVRRRVVSCSNNGTTSVSNSSSSNASSPSSVKRKYEYLIYGKRITDQSVVLSCTIKKDFEYNKVMPTFHHWRTGEKKFGLTFQTAADARAFDKGVRTAMEELLEELADSTDAGDDDVFMTLNLPVEFVEPLQTTDTTREKNLVKITQTQHPSATSADVSIDNYPYVQLTTLNHEYLYPIIDDHQKGDRLDRHHCSSDLFRKPDIIISQPTKNIVKRNGLRLRCKHCQELYSEQHNPRGSCEYAPDPIKRSIAAISCLSCAQCMLYHCMSDAEGDFAQNPCSCTTEDGCGRRWFGLALLSLIVPCLWIYPPLKAIHWCGVSCGICGGRHHSIE